jgi:hypothetical protein
VDERYILKEDLSARDMLIRQVTALIAGGMNPEILASKFPLAFGNKAEAVGAKLTGPAMRDESAVTLLPKPNEEGPMMRLALGRRETATKNAEFSVTQKPQPIQLPAGPTTAETVADGSSIKVSDTLPSNVRKIPKSSKYGFSRCSFYCKSGRNETISRDSSP